MARAKNISAQTRKILAAFVAQPQAWRYGYDLHKETGIQSGTLYPALMRLADQGALESEWRQPLEPGRPPRHAYRLTAKGVALAASQASTALSATESAAPAGAGALS